MAELSIELKLPGFLSGIQTILATANAMQRLADAQERVAGSLPKVSALPTLVAPPKLPAAPVVPAPPGAMPAAPAAPDVPEGIKVSGPPMTTRELARFQRLLEQQGLPPSLVQATVAAAPKAQAPPAVPTLPAAVAAPAPAAARPMPVAASPRSVAPPNVTLTGTGTFTAAVNSFQRAVVQFGAAARAPKAASAPATPRAAVTPASPIRIVIPPVRVVIPPVRVRVLVSQPPAAAGQQTGAALQLQAAQTFAVAVQRFRNLRQQSAPTQPRAPSGPAAGLNAAWMAHQRARASQDPVAIFDTADRLRRAQARFQAAQNQGQPSFLQRLGTFARSTRYGQGGLMPLLGRSLDVLGAKDPRIAVAVMAAVVAFKTAEFVVKTFATAVQIASESLGSLRAAQVVSGGTAAQTAQIAAMGIPGDQIAGIVGGLRATLDANPLAKGLAARAGAPGALVPQAFGSQNNAAIFNAIVDFLRAAPNEQEKLRRAHILQVESILPLIDVSNEMIAARRMDAAVSGSLLQQFGPASREYAAALQRIQFTFGSLLQSLVGPALPSVTRLLNMVADGFRTLAEYLGKNPQIIGAVVKRISDFVHTVAVVATVFWQVGQAAFNFWNRFSPLAAGFRLLGDFLGLLGKGLGWVGEKLAGFWRWILQIGESLHLIGKGSVDWWDHLTKAGQAQAAAAGAMNNAAGAMNNAAGIWQQGMHGGGQRAATALPGSLHGELLRRAIDGNTLRMGAFTF